MVKRNIIIFLSLVLLTAAGCATIPAGPSVMALPGSGKTFEEFQVDDVACRQWAAQQIGISPQETMGRSTATGAIVGTAIGAGVGAALGAAAGDAGTGAAIGAGSGLLIGSSAGAESGQYYGWQAQRRYDIAYTQCMYAKGNDIPEMVTRPRRYRRAVYPPPPPPEYSPYPDTTPPGE